MEAIMKKRKQLVKGWKMPLVLAWLALGPACNFTKYHPSTSASLTAFDRAGSVLPQVDAGDYATGVKASSGPYRMVPGDVLSIQVAPREGGVEFSTVKSDAL